jgi:hypothetical protein
MFDIGVVGIAYSPLERMLDIGLTGHVSYPLAEPIETIGYPCKQLAKIATNVE